MLDASLHLDVLNFHAKLDALNTYRMICLLKRIVGMISEIFQKFKVLKTKKPRKSGSMFLLLRLA